MHPMDTPAETPTRLYRQLIDQGYDDAFVGRVRDAHELAADLHSARFRPSGRPFICHVLGTASILATARAEPDVVLCGLLHGLYDQGDFGDGTRGITESKRAAVRQAMGRDVEARLAAFCSLEWTGDDWESKRSLASELDAPGRDALLVRLANELEELIDYEIQFRRNADARLAELGGAVDVMSALAREIGQPELADAFLEIPARYEAHRLPSHLCDSVGANHDRPPRSLAKRPGLVAADFVARGRRWLRRHGARAIGRSRGSSED